MLIVALFIGATLLISCKMQKVAKNHKKVKKVWEGSEQTKECFWNSVICGMEREREREREPNGSYNIQSHGTDDRLRANDAAGYTLVTYAGGMGLARLGERRRRRSHSTCPAINNLSMASPATPLQLGARDLRTASGIFTRSIERAPRREWMDCMSQVCCLAQLCLAAA